MLKNEQTRICPRKSNQKCLFYFLPNYSVFTFFCLKGVQSTDAIYAVTLNPETSKIADLDANNSVFNNRNYDKTLWDFALKITHSRPKD